MTFEHKAKLLADALEVPLQEYRALMKNSNMNSLVAFGELLERARSEGYCASRVAKIVGEAEAIRPKMIARQRMMMMRTVMNSTPVLVTDLLSSRSKGAYGFGDGKAQQIFEGKAQVGDMSFSAVASPRLFTNPGVKDSGYVLRYCVGKVPFNEFEEHHPVYMLDPKIVESLTAWHKSVYPNQPMADNPLVSSMINLLHVPTHDWGHSWLLYDANARTSSFKDWGDDIFLASQRDENKLITNYEIVVAATHKYTWQVLQDSDDKVLPAILQELRKYHGHVREFAEFAKDYWPDKERADCEETYLMYVPLSTLPCVVDWDTPQIQNLLAQYPVVAEQTQGILGNLFNILASSDDGVPARSTDEAFKSTAEYIREYPLRSEAAARLYGERAERLISDTDGVNAEVFHGFRSLPSTVASQFTGFIADPSVFPTLSSAFVKLESCMFKLGYNQDGVDRVFDRVKVDTSGHIFFRLSRQELDINKFSLCEQDKKVLLVSISEGIRFPLRMRTSVNLMHEISKQRTFVTSSDMLVFNVGDESSANEILAAGKDLNGEEFIKAIVDKGNELADIASTDGARDIYPIRKHVALHLYGTNATGFQELLGRRRFASATGGPVELELHDGSTQRTLDGVFVYIPGAQQDLFANTDPDPDLHGIESRVFDRTYSAAAASFTPFSLSPKSALTQDFDTAKFESALHEFLGTLLEINLQVDLGSANRKIGRGLY